MSETQNPSHTDDDSPSRLTTFTYQAQFADGAPVSGSIEAPTALAAKQQLAAMQLRVVNLQAAPAKRGRALRGDDFAAFNQQLAQLTASGMPLEKGLRLIAQDIGSGRLQSTINQVAADLESGRTLAESFERHRAQFPLLYGKLVAAGVRANNLSGMLLSLGRHLDMLARMRALFWQSVAYPLAVLMMMMLVLGLLGVYVLPAFEEVFMDFDTQLPALTQIILRFADFAPYLLAAAILVLVAGPILRGLMRALSLDAFVIDAYATVLPLIGRVLRYNLQARWCDATRLGVEAGLPLPQAMELAHESIGSPSLAEDSRAMIEQMERGEDVARLPRGRILSPTITASIALASQRGELGPALAGLAEMYQQQADVRLDLMRAVIGPALLLVLSVLIGLIVLALFMPLLTLITLMAGG